MMCGIVRARVFLYLGRIVVSLVDAENRGLYEKKGQEKTYNLVCMSGSGNRPDDWGNF